MPHTETIELVPTTYDHDRQYTEIGVSAPSEAYLDILAGVEVANIRSRPRRRVRNIQRLPKLELTITQSSDGSWIADERTTAQFGVGTTPHDAVADLFTTISEYLAVMQVRRYQLAPHLLQQLEWLEGRH